MADDGADPSDFDDDLSEQMAQIRQLLRNIDQNTQGQQ